MWRTPSGKRVQVDSTRMVSFAQRHLAVMTFEVTLLDAAAPVAISSQVLNRQDADRGASVEMADRRGAFDPRKAERFTSRVLLPEARPATTCARTACRCATSARESGMTIALAVDHDLQTDNDHQRRLRARATTWSRRSTGCNAQAGVADPADQDGQLPHRPGRADARAARPLRAHARPGQRAGRGPAVRRPARLARGFWERSDVEITGQPAIQQAVRWNLFSVIQAAARADGIGIPAKGVTGSGYGGHYFWDTEIYVMPFLTYTSPWAARNALRFRHSLLESARYRARQLAQKGALFAWRTINGEEASAYYAAGTAQYHIDADISYALSQYVGATGDYEFLDHEAIDIFVETARLWADLGFWRKEDGGAFHIHGVTGPDEYTTVVNDNLYTNVHGALQPAPRGRGGARS